MQNSFLGNKFSCFSLSSYLAEKLLLAIISFLARKLLFLDCAFLARKLLLLSILFLAPKFFIDFSAEIDTWWIYDFGTKIVTYSFSIHTNFFNFSIFQGFDILPKFFDNLSNFTQELTFDESIILAKKLLCIFSRSLENIYFCRVYNFFWPFLVVLPRLSKKWIVIQIKVQFLLVISVFIAMLLKP